MHALAMKTEDTRSFYDASPPGAAPASATATSKATLKCIQRRTVTPTPEPDSEPVFHPLRLRPSRTRPPISVVTPASASPPLSSDEHVDMRAPSSLTFGSRLSSGFVEDADTLFVRELPPVFTRGHARNRLSLLPDRRAVAEAQSGQHRVLGMGGTMGGSAGLGYEEQKLDASDPDSDIPNELQVILSASRGHQQWTIRSHSVPRPSKALAPLAWSSAACTVAYLTFAAAARAPCLPLHQFRPLSMLSVHSVQVL
ncbi:hypothetical protein DFH08DRAFT_948536 [Mycena albidolilacea]|uniref:Uncharacterized protein n=1 Tax=Mycena albidolilacea TaxID=1033008 RepID=A0AAD7AR69_9AGAR|nr:hypothetical protein DFH08DRAFT_948536 [Mycena albidolilacea]